MDSHKYSYDRKEVLREKIKFLEEHLQGLELEHIFYTPKGFRGYCQSVEQRINEFKDELWKLRQIDLEATMMADACAFPSLDTISQ